MIKLKILSENRDNCQFKGESGLSVLVETCGEKFLLDTGYSDLFMKNAELMGVDLSQIDTLVLTHGHSDHTNGIQYLHDGMNIILHPAAYKDRWSIRKKEYVGLPLSQEQLHVKHNVIESLVSIEFLPNCYFLGEVPMLVDFEMDGNFSTTLDEELTQTDFTEDDSGIVIKTSKGLFVMTGCGHRGVCNTIEHAKRVTGEDKIFGVFGGFHLRNLSKQKDKIDKTIEYLKQNNIRELYLGHCVTDEVIDYFEQNLKDVKIIRLASGMEFELKLQQCAEKEQ